MSIRAQLSRSLIFALCATMGSLLLILNWGVSQLSNEYILSRLQHDAESIIAALELDPVSQTWRLSPGRSSMVYQRAFSGHYYVISGPGVEIRSRSLWDYPVDFIEQGKGQENSFQMPGANDQNWLVWQQGFSKKDTLFTLSIVEDTSPLDALRWRYSLWAIVVILCGAFALFFIQQWILIKNFRYLDTVRGKIQAFRYSEEKPDLSNMPHELAPLADDIDQLLQQLKQRVSRSRNSLGNLAHEIKRPLQRLQQLQEESEVLQGPDVKRLLDDIQWLIQRELKRARIVGVSSPGRQTDLAVDVPPLIDILERLYPGVKVNTDFRAPLIIPQDRDDMLELIGNLLDNACKYATGDVSLLIEGNKAIEGSSEGSSEGRSQQVLIKVRDDGEGLPQQSIERLMLRGQRLDERHEGAGLGLSICLDIVESYNGSFKLENITPHGIMVTVEMPY